MPDSPARVASLDIVRIVGVIAVVAGHVWGDVPTVRALLYSWHVPIFFVLSGYLDTVRPLPEIARRRARSMLLPYVTWLAVITALFPGLLPWQNLLKGGIYLTRPYSAFWFVTALFVAVIVASVIRRFPLAAQWTVALLLVSFGWFWGSTLAFVWWSAAIGGLCLCFVVAGRSLRRLDTSSRIGAAIAALLLIAALSAAVAGLIRPLDLKYGDFGTPVASVAMAMVISASMIVLAEHLFRGLGPRPSAVVSRIAMGAFTVVLAHAAVLQSLAGMERRIVPFLAALAIPWLLALILLRTPISVPVTGGERQQRLSLPARR